MRSIFISREMAQLILLQRNELLTPFLKKIRKVFGRYLFTNFISKYFISKNQVGIEYMNLMEYELRSLSKYLSFNDKNILSIGSGLSGLELSIYKNYKNNFFSIIEKNYVSQKVVYGWDKNNNEAYNRISLVEKFLIKNGMDENKFKIYNYDSDNLPENSFDYIISLYSLDYHYDFNLYYEYLKKNFSNKTKIIFDTIRPDYFKKIFTNVDIINIEENTVHKSKRIICSGLKSN